MKTFNKKYLSILGVVTCIFGFTSNVALAGNCTSATMIYSVPVYIDTPGTYCLANNVTYINSSTSTTAAIEIATYNVILDLNGKTLSGRFANNTQSHGLEGGIYVRTYVYGHPTDVVVRNGTVTGFRQGVSTGNKTSADRLLIENMTITSMVDQGISIGYGYGCNDCIIRNNVITGINVGLETNHGSWQGAYGILVWHSDRVQIYDNFIFNLKSNEPTFQSYGIQTRSGTDFLISNNTIANITSATPDMGMYISTGNTTVQNNNLMHLNRGIWYRYGSGVYSGTTYTDVNIPYQGGTDGGNNQ